MQLKASPSSLNGALWCQKGGYAPNASDTSSAARARAFTASSIVFATIGWKSSPFVTPGVGRSGASKIGSRLVDHGFDPIDELLV
jgi:hypothetical protein